MFERSNAVLLVERDVLLDNPGSCPQISINNGALLSPFLQKVAVTVVVVGHVVLYLPSSES